MRLINLNWVVFLCLIPSLIAQRTSTNNLPNRQISLEECVRLALEHNFGIQIDLSKSRVAQYNLEGSYALYEPTLQADARHNYSRAEGTVSGGIVSVATEEQSDALRSSIIGELPTGLTYDLGFRMTYRESRSRRDLAGTNQLSGVDDYITGVGISLTQPLLRDFWISQPRADIKISRGNVKITEALVHLSMMSVVLQVEQAYFELIAAMDQVKVHEKALELAQQLFNENRKRVEAGVLAPLDEKQAESGVAVARADLIAARSRVVLQENILKNVITDEYQGWHAARLQPTEKLLAMAENYDHSQSWYSALHKRPDFTQARLELENQGVRVRLALNRLFPALDLVGGYGRGGFDNSAFRRSFDDIEREDNPNYYIGTVLSIPLGNRAQRSSYRAAKEIMRQQELALQQKHQQIMVEVDDAITTAEANYQQIPARREARLYAEAALDAEQKKLENGKSTSFFVLQLQRDLTTARAAEIRALADYNKALSDLYFKDGTILERRHIHLQFR